MVEFTLMGQPFSGLNGGPLFQFNEAISFQIPVETQAEADRLRRFKSPGSAQRFLSVLPAVHNTFNAQRHLTSRNALRILRGEAFDTWRKATAA